MNNINTDLHDEITKKQGLNPMLLAAAVLGFIGTFKSLFVDIMLLFDNFIYLSPNKLDILQYAATGVLRVIVLAAQLFILINVISVHDYYKAHSGKAFVLTRISTAFGVVLIAQTAYVFLSFVNRIKSYKELVFWIIAVIVGALFSFFIWKSIRNITNFYDIGDKPRSDIFLIVWLCVKIIFGIVLFGFAIYYFVTFLIKFFFYMLCYFLISSEPFSREATIFSIHIFGTFTSYISYLFYLFFLISMRKEKSNITQGTKH